MINSHLDSSGGWVEFNGTPKLQCCIQHSRSVFAHFWINVCEFHLPVITVEGEQVLLLSQVTLNLIICLFGALKSPVKASFLHLASEALLQSSITIFKAEKASEIPALIVFGIESIMIPPTSASALFYWKSPAVTSFEMWIEFQAGSPCIPACRATKATGVLCNANPGYGTLHGLYLEGNGLENCGVGEILPVEREQPCRCLRGIQKTCIHTAVNACFRVLIVSVGAVKLSGLVKL